MYLYATKDLSGGWCFEKDEVEKKRFADALDVAGLVPSDLFGDRSASAHLQFTVMYWRKANAIHNWFVKHVQGGEDKCRPHYVSRDQLKALKETCERVLADRTLAAALLPPSAGFFFGGTELDAWYWESLVETAQRLSAILSNPRLSVDNNWEFEYRSSW